MCFVWLLLKNVKRQIDHISLRDLLACYPPPSGPLVCHRLHRPHLHRPRLHRLPVASRPASASGISGRSVFYANLPRTPGIKLLETSAIYFNIIQISSKHAEIMTRHLTEHQRQNERQSVRLRRQVDGGLQQLWSKQHACIKQMALESLESKPIKAVKNMRNSESDKFGWQVEFGRKDTRKLNMKMLERRPKRECANEEAQRLTRHD